MRFRQTKIGKTNIQNCFKSVFFVSNGHFDSNFEKKDNKIRSFLAIFSTSVIRSVSILSAAEIDFYDDPNQVTKIRI